MKIRVSRRFTATHAHAIPPVGDKCEEHSHDWLLSVTFEGRVCPTYWWVADFAWLERLLKDCTSKASMNDLDANPTTERLAAHFAHELAWRLPPDGPIVVMVELHETDERSAIYEPSTEPEGFGPGPR